MDTHDFARPWSRHVGGLLFATVLSVSSACGVAITPSTSQEFAGTLAEFTVKHHDFQAGKAGLTIIRLTWSNGAVDLDLALRGTSCSDEEFETSLGAEHSGHNCSVPVSYSGSGGEKFEEYTIDAIEKDQQIRIFVINNGPGPQDYKVTVNIG